MSNITITLDATQIKGFEYIGADPQEWIENCAFNRARQAVDEIVKIYVAHCLDSGLSIPSTREEIVDAAFSSGVVKTPEQLRVEAEAEMAARIAAQQGA
jgi:ribosomal protein L31E